MNGWTRVRVRDVAATFDGPHATPASTKTAKGGPVFLGISSLQSGRLDLSQSAFMSESDFALWTRRVTPHADDVVFSYETRLGEAAIIPAGLRCALGRRLALMRPDRSRIDPRFLLYYFLGPRFQEVIRSSTVHGSTVERIMLTDFPDFPIELPPPAEQHWIAGTLGALDDKIESNRRIEDGALDLAEALYVDACERGAEVVPLRDAGGWLSGGTPSTSTAEYWGGELPWISAASLKSFYVEKSDRTLTSAGADAATNVVPAGTVLMLVRGMSLKTEFRFGVAQRPVAFGQDVKAILPSINGSVLALALRAARGDVLGLVDEAGHGTGRLQTDRLEQLPIAVPADPTFVQKADALIARGATAARENLKLGALRDALLPELLSGRLLVPETYEAAMSEGAQGRDVTGSRGSGSGERRSRLEQPRSPHATT